ncbi:MAG: hypothetical protein ACKO2P_11145 [Planctomycetota bacterium]
MDMRAGCSSRFPVPPLAFRAAVATAMLMAFVRLPFVHAQQQASPAASLLIRSTVLEQILKDSRSEQQPVAKNLLQSDVIGCQTTLTESRLHIVPNSQPLQFHVQTSGTVSSQTTGVNPQAVVQSQGNHRFQVIKPFWFDGRRFLTRPSHGTIEASQSPQRVFSAAGARMPILAPLTDQIAWNRVRRMQPQINQAVAMDLSSDVFPQVDRRVEQEFLGLQERWAQSQRFLQHWLPQQGLEWSATAQDDCVLLTTSASPDTRTPTAHRPDHTTLDGPRFAPPLLPAATLQPAEDIVLTVSETALTDLAAAAFPGGTRVTDTQLQRLTELLPDLLTAHPDATARMAAVTSDTSAPATFFTLELPPRQPLTVTCSDGDLKLSFRFRIVPLIGSDSGWMNTTVFLRGKRLDASSWTLTVRDAAVNSASDDQQSVQTGTVWPALIRTRLSTLLATAREPALPTDFTVTLAGLPPAQLRLLEADSRGGKLRIALRVQNTGP